MTTHPLTTRTGHPRSGPYLRAVLLLPWAAGELAALLHGRPDGAARTARERAGLPVDDRPAPRSSTVLAHATLSAILGAVAWFLLGLLVLGGLRGPLYGFVDPGPYDHSWGGPTLAGAWLVHALVWAVLLPVWVLLTRALSAIQRALTRRLLDEDGSHWAVPVALLVSLGAVLFVRAWVHQL